MSAYYNENDPFAAAWLRELIKDGLIVPGEVDERSIRDVAGADLCGFTQVHLFAGIGGWSYALRLAGWRDDEPVWSGSCPCQPFSAAGKRRGTADDRHLWPEMCRLVAECLPPVVFGEQVASKDGRLWLAGIRVDLEALDYAVGAADLCAAGVGAPHIRQRLYWVADAMRDGARPRPAASDRSESTALTLDGSSPRPSSASGERSALSRPGEPNGTGLQPRDVAATPARYGHTTDATDRIGLPTERVGDTCNERLPQRPRAEDRRAAVRDEGASTAAASTWHGEFIDCADGKARRVEPSIQPLAHGVPNRVGTLRGAGNAIVPQAAAEFILAYRSPITAP